MKDEYRERIGSLKIGDRVRVTAIDGYEEEPWLRVGDVGEIIDLHHSPAKGIIPTVQFFDNPERELALLLYKGDGLEVIG